LESASRLSASGGTRFR